MMDVIMKIKFNSDDNLPLNKPLQFHNITITIRSVFEEDGKLYPQWQTIGILKILPLSVNHIFAMVVMSMPK